MFDYAVIFKGENRICWSLLGVKGLINDIPRSNEYFPTCTLQTAYNFAQHDVKENMQMICHKLLDSPKNYSLTLLLQTNLMA